MSATEEKTQAQVDLGVEAGRVGATYRMATMRERHAELGRAEAQARADLAAAIIAMDEACERAEREPWMHSLREQAAVELAKTRYAQALADLLRGEAQSCEEEDEHA